MSETLYENGPIITMEPEPAEAVLTRDGRIVFAGTREDARALAAKDARRVDLDGRALLPAFIDSHGHFAGYATSLLQARLENAVSLQEMGERIRAFIRENAVPAGEWVMGKGYDHNMLIPARHPSRKWLDRVAPNHPVILQHQSGHMGVLNTMALERLGVDEDTPSPEGGRIEKDAAGRLTGYMEENAFLQYQKRAPMPTADKLAGAFDRAQARYASYGITTVQEGMLVEELAGLYAAYLDTGRLKLDVVAYMDMASNRHIKEMFGAYMDGYRRHFRIGGYKMFLDGSPQGRTAWMRTPYTGADEQGYPVLSDEEAEARIRTALTEGRQLLTHCNGDAAAAQYLSAYRRVSEGMPGHADIRPVIIHAQLLGTDQLPEVKALGVIPSFFVAHVFHWGDVHIRNFGRERASAISPAAAAGREGIRYTFHQDAPVIEPDMMETVWCAVNRLTGSGVCLGPEQRVPVEDALKAVTLNAAWQYFEEQEKGSIRAGKRADLVILDRDPLKVDPSALRTVRVLETVKDGETIYKA